MEDLLALGEDWRALGEELALDEECLEPIIKRNGVHLTSVQSQRVANQVKLVRPTVSAQQHLL